MMDDQPGAAVLIPNGRGGYCEHRAPDAVRQRWHDLAFTDDVTRAVEAAGRSVPCDTRVGMFG